MAAAPPITNNPPHETTGLVTGQPKQVYEDNIDEQELILVHGCLCENTSLYVETPKCIGCSGKSECICCTLVGASTCLLAAAWQFRRSGCDMSCVQC